MHTFLNTSAVSSCSYNVAKASSKEQSEGEKKEKGSDSVVASIK
jgi:hypothetical protein